MSETIRTLVDIRCPNRRFHHKYKKHVTCHKLCLRAAPGSSGEAYCNDKNCKSTFLFEVSSDHKPPTINKEIKIAKS